MLVVGVLFGHAIKSLLLQGHSPDLVVAGYVTTQVASASHILFLPPLHSCACLMSCCIHTAASWLRVHVFSTALSVLYG